MTKASNSLIRNSLAFIFVLTLTISTSFSQDYFHDTWYGFQTGEYQDGRFPYTADIGDLNNDGLIDLAIGQFALDPGFKIVFADGINSFGPSTHYLTEFGTQCIRISDFNGDGFNDLVLTNSGIFYGFGKQPATWEYGNSVSFYFNNGDGTFYEQAEIITNLHPEELEITDFDNDGDPDVAVANFGRPSNPGNTVSIIENEGNGSFSLFANITVDNFPFSVSAGNINGDEWPDLVVAHESSVKTILINNGDGFNSPQLFAGTYPSEYNLGGALKLKDLDNDDDDDLVFYDSWGSSTDYINVYRNDGSGNYSNYEEYMYPSYYGSGDQCDFADLNNDGWLDIIAASFNGQSGKGFFVFESDGSGGFLPVEVYTSGMASAASLCTDSDGDGDSDVLVVDYSMSVNLHLNDGSGSFPRNPTYEIEGGSAEDVDAGDIDLDGDIDVITSSDDGFETNISVLLNNGDGTFEDFYTIIRNTSDQGGAHAKLHDMNGNGLPDVLFTSPITNLFGYLVFIALNDGNGGFEEPFHLSVASCGWGDVDACDLDGDNDLDIVATEFLACMGVSESGRRLYILKNNGDATFQAPVIYIIGNNPESITTGDYNDDGNVDIVTAHYGPYGSRNFIQVHLGDGTGDLAGPDTYIVGDGPHDIISADFNNDDIIDLATGNTGADGIGEETMSVLIGNGDGSFQPSVTYDAPYSSTLMGNSGLIACDPDQDGDHDILLANQSSSDLSAYINQGDGTFEHLYRIGVNGYGARGLAYRDFTGDGVMDVVTITAPAIGFIVTNHLNLLIGKGVPVFVNKESSPGEYAFLLDQNYPNPALDRTNFSFRLDHSGYVSLKIYEMNGREVTTLVNGFQQKGNYVVPYNTADLPSGIYPYRLQADNSSETRELIVR